MKKVLNESKLIYAINIFIVASWCLLFSHGSHLNTKTNLNFIFSVTLTRHAKRYELGGRRHFEKIRLKVNVASRKNSTPTLVSKRSLTYYKTGSKAFFMLRFSAARLSNILYDIKGPF